jgi:Spy/CpxP family protein refolding chaperone
MKLSAVIALTAVLGAQFAHAGTEQPYAGQDVRPITSLEPAFIHGLRSGAGLGFAKAAELNGWPGPLHVLELKDQLALTEAQISSVSAIRAEMLAKAISLGEALIDAERDLDRLFDGAPDRAQILAATTAIGALRAELRTAHLDAHLKTTPLLTRHQQMMYAKARGYLSGAGGHSHDRSHN